MTSSWDRQIRKLDVIVGTAVQDDVVVTDEFGLGVILSPGFSRAKDLAWTGIASGEQISAGAEARYFCDVRA
jgi:hypothetical protein